MILTSPHSRTELESLQHALALDEPFIAEARGVLSIPSGCFSPLLVGVGTSKADQPLLRHVAIPVLIRNPSVDQRALRSQFPDAYVALSAGLDGWNEALVGASLAETDADVRGA